MKIQIIQWGNNLILLIRMTLKMSRTMRCSNIQDIISVITLILVFQTINAGVRTSGRLVASPSLEACKNRPKHYMDKRTGHYYFYSGKSKYGALKVGWLDARNICRSMCMDLISVESPEENTMVHNIVTKYKADGVWTSGRLCNFHGCEAPHLQPKNINGWFWSGSGVSIPATNVTPSGWPDNPWSHTGYLSQFVSHPVAQPDNAEYLLQRSGVTIEACLAVLSNWYNDGIQWHDSACYRAKHWICEDSEKMVNFLHRKHPNAII